MKKESFAFRLRAWLNNIPIQDPIERRIASLLQAILMGLIVVVMLATIVSVTNPTHSVQEKLSGMRGNLFGFLVIALPLGLLRRGYFRISALVVITILLITPTLAVTIAFDLLNSGGILFQFTLAIILAGLLVNRRALTLTFSLSTAVVGFAALRGQNPTSQLPIATNFILFNGLIALFIDQFGITLRTALTDALARERELQSEMAERQRAEAQIEYQANLLAHINDAVIAVDNQFHINVWNHAAEIMYGWSASEALGNLSTNVIPSDMTAEVRQETLRQLRELGRYRNEIIQYRKDGQPVYVETSTITLHDKDKQVTGFLSVNRDITERKQAEEEHHKSEKKFSDAFHTSPAAMTITRIADGTFIDVNEEFLNTFEFTRDEVIGHTSIELNLLGPEARRLLIERQLATGGLQNAELEAQSKSGKTITILFSSSPIDINNEAHHITTMIDITERKQAQEKIAYQAYLLENVNDAVIGSDENSIIRFWNQGAERMFGWKAEEVLGRSGRETLRSELINTDREVVLKMLAEHGRWKGEATLHHKDGSQVITEVSSITLRDANGLITGYASVYRDIAERKQAEEKIKGQNQRLKVLREIDTAILAADSVENIISAALNHIRELIDCRRANLTLIDWETNESVIFDVSTVNETEIPKGRRFPLAQYQDVIQALSQNQLLLINDLRALADPRPAIQSLLKDGLQSLCSLPLSSQGNLIGMFTIYSEIPSYFDEEKISLGREVANQIAIAITQNNLLNALRNLNAELEQRVVERTAALSQANSLMQMMLDNMPDQIYFKDAQSRFIRNSKSQARALGLSDPAEAIGKSDFDFFPHAQLSYEREQEIIRSGKPLVDEEERVVWPDGRETWVSTTKIPLSDPTGQIIGTFGISRDITDRKQAEMALQKAKLELEAANKELEAFSYSVSHDLRSPLRTIDGFSQALLEDYADQLPAEGQDDLRRVRAATQRMGQLIDDLLNLSKVTRVPMKLVSVNLSGLVQGIVAELQRTQPERRVNFKITPNLKAYGDPSLLQAVLENLLNNAWKFTTKREQAEIEFGSKTENSETIYFIRDNGAGFDMAYVDKLFGAFQRLHAMTEFSGTGIGLATVQRIINRHGGRIWAEGAVNQGATFFFTLPVLERPKPETLPQEKDSLARRAREII